MAAGSEDGPAAFSFCPGFDMILYIRMHLEQILNNGKNRLEIKNDSRTNKNPGTRIFARFRGRAEDGTRTRDLLTTNEVRYRLCHFSLSVRRREIYYYTKGVLSSKENRKKVLS